MPEVKKVTLDKMYAAGLTTLEAMFLATPGDIAATTGIAEALRGADRRAVPRLPGAGSGHGAGRDARARARAHRGADGAAPTRARRVRARSRRHGRPRAAEQKKELRKARAQTLLDIQVVLARLGEVDRLAELERLPFEQKLAHLESFLEEARDKYVAQP